LADRSALADRLGALDGRGALADRRALAGRGALADRHALPGRGAVLAWVSLGNPGRPPRRWLGLASRRSGPTPHLLRHVTLRVSRHRLRRTISLGSRRYEIVTAVKPYRMFFYAGALRFSGMATTDLSLALLGPPVVRRDGAPV